jgi:hypothetical protein
MARKKIKQADVVAEIAKAAGVKRQTVSKILDVHEQVLVRAGFLNLVEKRKKNPELMVSDGIINHRVGTWYLRATRGTGLPDGTLVENALGEKERYEYYNLCFNDSRMVTDEEIDKLKKEMAASV